MYMCESMHYNIMLIIIPGCMNEIILYQDLLHMKLVTISNAVVIGTSTFWYCQDKMVRSHQAIDYIPYK
jgi:putative effector of murein hydrolase LrgA (UPF0299 family)